MLRLLSCAILLQLALSLCPPSCNCTQLTIQCHQCLWDFNRLYGGDCVCYSDYVEKVPPSDACRSLTCLVYGNLGCIQCPANMKLELLYGWQECVCLNGLYYKTADYRCVCRAPWAPTDYYQQKFTGQCFSCPLYCTCDLTGCSSCDIDSKRTIKDMGTYKTCPCQKNYYDNGHVCGMYPGCFVGSNGQIWCDVASHRQLNSLGIWTCIYPYQDVDGTCQCLGNYQYAMTSQNYVVQKCICPSKQLNPFYYEYDFHCLKCPQGCICNSKGCTFCNSSLNRVITASGCPCAWPYIQENGVCICTQPFFKRFYIKDGVTLEQCVCLSEYEQSVYYLVAQAKVCQKCPSNCTCNYLGCNFCQNSTHRKITYHQVNGQPFYKCNECMPGTFIQNDKCVCSPLTTYNDNTGRCECVSSPQIYNTSDGGCKVCPDGCTCQLMGCISCDASTGRTIYYSWLYSDCPCSENLTEVNGTCYCLPPFTLTYGCTCQQPYFLNQSQCMCMSFQNNSKYYIALDGTCAVCPNGCKCNASGCVECHPDTMRIIYVTTVSTCPCLQNAQMVNGTCTICQVGFMVSAGKCVACTNCLTCDILGCTSCPPGTILSDHECVCNSTYLINVRGQCVCPASTYMTQGRCEDCPSYCLTCTLQNQKVQCTSCRRNSNRVNSPIDGCPCSSGFKQNLPATAYCCPLRCRSCDEVNCTSCNDLMNRQLDDGDCVCKPTFSLMPDGYCGCLSGFVFFMNMCIECPISCKQCDFNISTGLPYCVSCHSNTNRIMNSSSCQCQIGYTEAEVAEQSCYPLYCTALKDGVCIECSANRVVDQEGLCGCPPNFYDGGSIECIDCKTIPGCIECYGSMCNKCDEANNFYLVAQFNNKTKLFEIACFEAINKTQVIVSQGNQITILFILSSRLRSYTTIKQVRIAITNVFPNASTTQQLVQNLTVSSVNRIKPQLLRVRMSNPEVSVNNALIMIRLTMVNYSVADTINGTDQFGNYFGNSQVLYVHRAIVYSHTEMSFGQQSNNLFASIIVCILLVLSAILYILSYKHNSIVFLMQNMALIAYVKTDVNLLVTPLLHCLKYSYYNFVDLKNGLIPQGYIMPQFGNFNHFQTDSSILNIVPIAVGIAVVNCVLILVFRALYYLIYKRVNRDYAQKSKIHILKRYLYRGAEFLYKTTMFPLLFCSIITLVTWNAEDMSSNLLYTVIVRVLAIVILIVYSVVTAWQWFWESITIVWKIQNLNEFISSLFCALILGLSVFRKEYLLVMVIIAVKAAVSVISKKYFLRDFTRIQYSRAAITLFSVVAVASIEANNPMASLSLMLISIFLDIALQIYVIIWTLKLAKRSGSKEAITEEAATSMDKIEFVKDTKVNVDDSLA